MEQGRLAAFLRWCVLHRVPCVLVRSPLQCVCVCVCERCLMWCEFRWVQTPPPGCKPACPVPAKPGPGELF